MAVRTRRLGAVQVVTVGSSAVTAVFTVPTDRVAIVKEWVWTQLAGTTPVSVYLYVIAVGGVSYQVDFDTNGANDSPAFRARWLVLQEGEQLAIAQSSGRTIQCYVSGTLLDGDPA